MILRKLSWMMLSRVLLSVSCWKSHRRMQCVLVMKGLEGMIVLWLVLVMTTAQYVLVMANAARQGSASAPQDSLVLPAKQDALEPQRHQPLPVTRMVSVPTTQRPEGHSAHAMKASLDLPVN